MQHVLYLPSLFLVFSFWLLSGANFKSNPKHTGKEMLQHLAEGWGFNRREPGRRGLDEREWWASTSAWLRMRGFTPSRSGISTTDRHTQWDTYTSEALPSHSAICSPRVLWYSWRKWSGIAGVSYFSAVSWQVFSSSSPACVRCLTQDHLEDMDRSRTDGCVSNQSSVLISKPHLWME